MTSAPARITAKQRPADRIFRGGATFAGSLILVILAAVAIFLIAQSIPAFTVDPAEIKGSPDSFWTYVGPLVFGTVWAAAIALVIAVPLAIGIALFISHYAPRRLAQGLGYVIDLLAAVPSVVFGLWGGGVLAPAIQPAYGWLAENASWFPLFAPETAEPGSGIATVSGTGRTILTVGIVLAVMILPIITALCREVFLQTPTLHEEAALALGATRWEMIRMAVLPYSRAGITGAAMLGLGRAIGETIAATLLIGNAADIGKSIFSQGYTLAAVIANEFGEAANNKLHTGALIAAGLVLFVVTLLVNAIARAIVNRGTKRQATGGAAMGVGA